MTEHELDRAIYRLFIDAQKVEEKQAAGEVIPFNPSVRYQHSMRTMCRDPRKWMQNRARPVWKSALRRVAMILLAVSIGFGGLMAGVPPVRAAVVRWVSEWYETHIVYQYSGDEVFSKSGEYEITALPDGFSEVKRIVSPNVVLVDYADDKGNVVSFDYIYMHQGAASSFETERAIVSEITVRDMMGQYFEAMVPGEFNTITWIDERNSIQFTISGLFDQDALLHMAMSVS